MTSNLKVILSAVGVAALLASPAMAKPVHHQQAAPSTVNIPADARASVERNTPAQQVYSPDVRVQPNQDGDLNRDFQLGGEK